MPWIPFTAEHIKSRLAARELTVYERTAAKAYPDEDETEEAEVPDGAEDRLPSIVEQVCSQFRGAIRANPNVTYIGPAGTLPDFCVAHAAVLGRVALIGMVPVPEGMTDPRKEEYRAANDFLKALMTMAPGAFLEADTASAAPTPCPSYGGKPRMEF